MKSKILITICARGGSKGVPGKNIVQVGSKPLIAYTIEQAKVLSDNTGASISLSTDSEEIRGIASQYGILSEYLRPAHLATDKAGKIAVIADLMEYEEDRTNMKYDFIIDLDVTSPLRQQSDILACLKKIESDPKALNLFTVSPAKKNPYFTLVEQKNDGYYAVSKQLTNQALSRQSAPPVFELNGSIYIYRRSFFSKHPEKQSAYSERSLIYEMPEICFDVDEPIDLEFLEFLINSGKVDFMLP